VASKDEVKGEMKRIVKQIEQEESERKQANHNNNGNKKASYNRGDTGEFDEADLGDEERE
jgi:hypothetical protein